MGWWIVVGSLVLVEVPADEPAEAQTDQWDRAETTSVGGERQGHERSDEQEDGTPDAAGPVEPVELTFIVVDPEGSDDGQQHGGRDDQHAEKGEQRVVAQEVRAIAVGNPAEQEAGPDVDDDVEDHESGDQAAVQLAGLTDAANEALTTGSGCGHGCHTPWMIFAYERKVSTSNNSR